jgi:uncharacterized protein YdhG (YjbR/CyaY superfamily)
MNKKRQHFNSIDDYVASSSGEIKKRLETICKIVQEIAPGAEGKISYNMPAYFLGDRLVYFCAFKKHIGFYPASMVVFRKFRDELKKFKQSGKGTVQFPYDKPLPVELVKKIIQFRVKENRQSIV